jgi:hypothetical protein
MNQTECKSCGNPMVFLRTQSGKAMPVNAETALLPPQEGAWRLSNVLSLMAQSEKGDGAMNLEEAAMAVLK